MNIIDKINQTEKKNLLEEKQRMFDQLDEKYKKHIDLNYKPVTKDVVDVYNMVQKGNVVKCYKIISNGVVCQNKRTIRFFEQARKNLEYFQLSVNANHPNIFFKAIKSHKKPPRSVLKPKHIHRI